VLVEVVVVTVVVVVVVVVVLVDVGVFDDGVPVGSAVELVAEVGEGAGSVIR
jgi:hypothetical protein